MTDGVRVQVPATARRGEIIAIRTLVRHAMETGFRRTQTGEPIARNIITRFVCTYNGDEILRADLHPATAANPLLEFSTVAIASGTIEFRWTGDNGFSATEQVQIVVE